MVEAVQVCIMTFVGKTLHEKIRHRFVGSTNTSTTGWKSTKTRPYLLRFQLTQRHQEPMGQENRTHRQPNGREERMTPILLLERSIVHKKQVTSGGGYIRVPIRQHLHYGGHRRLVLIRRNRLCLCMRLSSRMARNSCACWPLTLTDVLHVRIHYANTRIDLR